MAQQEEEGEFDLILRRLGFGIWSILTITPCTFVSMYLSMASMAGAFLNAQVDHHCHVAALENTSWTLEERLNYSIPWLVGSSTLNLFNMGTEENGGELVRSQCYIYDQDHSNISHKTWDVKMELSAPEVNVTPTVPCSSWKYDTSTFESTFNMEWDLVCDRAGISVLFQGLYFLGAFVTEPVAGYLADRYGRRFVIRVLAAVSTAVAFSSSFANHYAIVLAARFIMGSSHNMTPLAYVMGVESSAPQYRTVTGMFLFLPFALAGMAFGGLAYFIRNWRVFLRVMSAVSALSFIQVLLVDESPRWLVRKGRLAEAVAVLTKAARWHGVELGSDEELILLLNESETSDPTPSRENERACSFVRDFWTDLKKLVKSPTTRVITLAMFGCWFFIGVIFWGISLSGGNWSTNPFLYMALSSLMEGVGYVGLTPFVGHCGRRPFLALTFFVCTVVLLSLLFIPSEFGWLVITMAMTGKFCSSAASNILFLSASELFPTTLRSRSVSFCSMMGRLGSVVTPFIVEALVTIYPWAPQAAFGICALMGTLLTLKIPESKEMTLPETIEDVEALYGKKRRISNTEK